MLQPRATVGDASPSLSMLIDVRIPDQSERGVEESILALSATLRSTAKEFSASRTRVVCDWIQYRNNFRTEVDRRSIIDPRARLTDELAIDLRRVKDEWMPSRYLGGTQVLRARRRDAGAMGPYLRKLHLALQCHLLARTRDLGGGRGAWIRAGAPWGRERRDEHSGHAGIDRGSLPDLGQPRRTTIAPRTTHDPRNRGWQWRSGKGLVG